MASVSKDKLVVYKALTPQESRQELGYRPESNCAYINSTAVGSFDAERSERLRNKWPLHSRIIRLHAIYNATIPTSVVIGYRRLMGSNLHGDEIAVDSSTYSKAKHMLKLHCENVADVRLAFKPVHRLLLPVAMFSMSWNHPDDAARISFKIGVIGIILGVLLWLFEPADVCDLTQRITRL
ncbi:MAG: hypothetical protein FGM24_06010 [Candidatus Kapabacteria bacterium]|nr:hypothetical protein [Candidatus Kapabacteria bacterium]